MIKNHLDQLAREQLLIDLMFSIAMRINANDRIPHDREELAKWMRDQLIECGFPVVAMGMSWAILLEHVA